MARLSRFQLTKKREEMPFVPDSVETTIRELLVDVLGDAPATVAAMTDDTPPPSPIVRVDPDGVRIAQRTLTAVGVPALEPDA